MLQIPKGRTNVSVVVRIVDSTDGTPETGVVWNTSGIDLWYRREGAAKVSVTEATLAALTTAHADGGFLTISNGWYRFDLPDAAFASGADGVQIGGTVTGMIVHAPYVQLTDLDLFDAVRAGLTALPNAAADAAGGLPISDAGGLDLDSRIETDIIAILVDTQTTLDTKLNDLQGAGFSSATDSNEALRNRGDSAWTGSATTSDSGTAQAGAAGSITLAATAPSVDNVLEGHLVYISAGTGAGQSKAIAENGYNGTTKVATIIGTWEVNPDATSVYEVTPDAITEFVAAPTAAGVADAVWDENTAGHTTAGTFGEQLKNDLDAVLADTGELQADWVNGGRLDLILDAILVDTGTTLQGEVDAIQAAVITNAAGADIAADIIALKAETVLILADTDDIGAAGAGLTAVPWNAAWDAEVQSEAADALVAVGLDHLVGVAVVGADVIDNSIIAKLVAKGATADFDTFVNTTDSLEAARDKLTDIEADTNELQADSFRTEVAAIEADTQDIQSRLPAALSGGGTMKCNVQRVNDVVIIGDGSATPFNV